MSRAEKCREVMARRWAGRREYWRELIGRQQAGGMSITEFCAQEGVHTSSFHAWRRKLGMMPEPEKVCGKFVEIAVVAESVREDGIVVDFPGGVGVRPGRKCDMAELRQVLMVVREVTGR